MPDDEGGGFGGGNVVDPATELKKWADAIIATAEAIDAVSSILDAPRSVVLEVNNTTSRPLILRDIGDHDWGAFRDPPDPSGIPPGTTGLFTSQSDRPLTGTQGHVKYHVDNEGTLFHLEWNVPYAGANESLCRVEGGRENYYITKYSTGGGNTKVRMRFMIGERARLNPKSSPDWRTCGNCKTLFFALDEGHCAARPLGIESAPSDFFKHVIHGHTEGHPAGDQEHAAHGHPAGHLPGVDPSGGSQLFGKHEAVGYYFRLTFGDPSRPILRGPNRQEDWRTCVHCKVLFYNGWHTKGVCPGRRDGHMAEAEGLEFQLVYALPPGPSQQDNWRFCDKCCGLFFLPHNADAVCPAGGNHHANSSSYVLDHVG